MPRLRKRTWLLLVVAALVLLRAFTWSGWLRPIVVSGGSMAPTLAGPAYHLECADCGFPFVCGSEQTTAGEMATCPNCGFPRNRMRTDLWRRGDRVLLDRATYVLTPPRRWECLAFRDASGGWTVKRVIGLPWETLALRFGDLYVNGRIARKSLPEFDRMAIAVHDTRYRPSMGNLPRRWRPLAAGSGWHYVRDHFGYEPAPLAGSTPADDAKPAVDWLMYHQWPGFSGAAPPLQRTEDVPVWDHYAYNDGRARGPLHEVSDIMLTLDAEPRGVGRLWLQLRNRMAEYRVCWDWNEQVVRVWNRDELLKAESAPGFPKVGRPLRIEWGLLDRRLFLSWEGTTLVEVLLADAAKPVGSHRTPMGIGVEGMPLRIDRLRIRRDVHFLGPEGTRGVWQAPDTQTESWFVLGDNVPFSIDSRFGTTRRIDAAAIRGKVLRWPEVP